MARTEKKFGQVVEPAANVNNELVASSVNRRNLSINITARSASKISLTTFTAAPSYNVSGLAWAAPEISTQKNLIGSVVATANGLYAFSIPEQGQNSAMIMVNPSTAAVGSPGSIIITTLNSYGSADLISTSPSSYVSSGGNVSVLLALPETGSTNLGLSSGVPATDVNYFRTVHSAPLKEIGGGLFVAISGSTGTAGGVGTIASAILIDTSSATGTWSSRALNTTDYVPGSERINAVHAVYSTSANKRCAVVHVVNNRSTELTSNTTIHPLRIYVGTKTTGQTQAQITTAYAFFSGANNGTAGNMQAALNAFNAMDYNEAKDLFAISHSTIANSIGTASSYGGVGATIVPSIPGSAAPAGFRVVTPTATELTPGRFFSGTDQFPSAPDGVSVPSQITARAPQVASLKFSPDGNHIAVMYNRNYSGSGNAMSVAVIYSVNSAGTWSHSYSSGSSILYRGGTSDSMAWLPDNSGIVIISGDNITDTERYVQFWVPMTGTVSYVHSSTSTQIGISRYSSGPKLSSQFKVASTTSAVSAAVTTSIFDNTPGIVISMGFLTSASNPPRLFYATSYRSSSSDINQMLSQIKFIDLKTAPVIGSSSSSAPAYINTIAQDLDLSEGQTIQISNIVVEPGERVYVESSTSDSVDITAYGVEIS
jgi:hypothetical protein